MHSSLLADGLLTQTTWEIYGYFPIFNIYSAKISVFLVVSHKLCLSVFFLFLCVIPLRPLSLQSREQDPVEDNRIRVCAVMCEKWNPIISCFSSACLTQEGLLCCLCRAPLVLFSGGMPRASYGDRHCLTILQDSSHVTLDFTSRVIDFFTIHCTDRDKGERVRWCGLVVKDLDCCWIIRVLQSGS